MSVEEKAAAVRERLAKHTPPSAEEVADLRRRLGFQDQPPEAEAIGKGLAQFAAKIGKDRAA